MLNFGKSTCYIFLISRKQCLSFSEKKVKNLIHSEMGPIQIQLNEWTALAVWSLKNITSSTLL